MVNKKTPERFCIRFNLSNPEHLEVVNILSSKGRNAASYIADAILCYEKSKQSNFGISFSNVIVSPSMVTVILSVTTISAPNTATDEQNIVSEFITANTVAKTVFSIY